MRTGLTLLAVGLLAACLASCGRNLAAPLSRAKAESKKMETATFAAGCFWGVEATFRRIKGVEATAAGYSGGSLENPTYEDVCTDRTGHAEAVQVQYDPAQVSYEQLLDVFWNNHDPTTPNRQGPDVGTQYRSVIFYHSPEQKAAAVASKEQARKERQVPAARSSPRSCRPRRSGGPRTTTSSTWKNAASPVATWIDLGVVHPVALGSEPRMTGYSVIIPAYNEEQWLGVSLSAAGEAMRAVGLAGEIIVVDNNSTDRTAEVARQHGAQVVFEPINQISRARNAGARKAGGQYLIFLDADTSLSAALLHKALCNLTNGKCCGGGAVVDLDGRLPWYARWILLWNRLSVRCKWAAGCFIYCLREGFAAVGGFSEKVFASEEIWFSRRLQRWGKPRGMTFQIITRPTIVTSSRKLHGHPVRNLLAFCFVLLFPFAVRSRRLSALWYRYRG